MTSMWPAALGMTVVIGLAGCESARPTRRAYSPDRQQAISPREAFDAAEAALSEHFEIVTRDREQGFLRTAAVETRERQPAGRLGDAIGTPRSVRKFAEVRVEPVPGGVNIWCSVFVEENETSAHRMFAQDRSLSDIPSDTPADREAATTEEQNTVWKQRGRDHAMERRIRARIRQFLEGA